MFMYNFITSNISSYVEVGYGALAALAVLIAVCLIEAMNASYSYLFTNNKKHKFLMNLWLSNFDKGWFCAFECTVGIAAIVFLCVSYWFMVVIGGIFFGMCWLWRMQRNSINE